MINVDLYKDDLGAISDPDLYAAVEDFTRIASPPADRIQEGYLLDFKESWSASALRTVAAFANTFGGLLLVGVSEKDGRADQLVGIPIERGELKTTIASAIASNVSPTPPYEIRDLAIPDGSAKHLCIVRVRKGNSLYLLTKKGESPVYVRNEDQSIQADAARLQALLATRLARESSYSDTIKAPLLPSMGFGVTQAHEAGGPGQRMHSETFLHLQLVPEEMQAVRLDIPVEEKLRSIIAETYPGLKYEAPSLSETRLKDWYQITYTETLSDYEMRWAVGSNGALYFATQVRCKIQNPQGSSAEVWSLCDLMTNLDCTIQAAHRFWSYLGYVGEARLSAALHVEGLQLLERGGLPSVYASAFYERDGSRKRAKPLSTTALTKAAKQGARADGAIDLTYAIRSGNHAEPVALVTNQLLRDLGHAANLADLRSLL